MADAQQGERFKLSPRRITDADWFGLEADQSGTINLPIEDPYPAPPTQPALRHQQVEREYRRPTRRH
ncbi:hypothetical protein [Arthrobacter sp. MP_2.3]|uniref:hypothetical protein n=1 Tax=Arthrobacter sp. MP_2.3 TaxID=3349633 RepID=UPI0038D3883C